MGTFQPATDQDVERGYDEAVRTLTGFDKFSSRKFHEFLDAESLPEPEEDERTVAAVAEEAYRVVATGGPTFVPTSAAAARFISTNAVEEESFPVKTEQNDVVQHAAVNLMKNNNF
jgi:hypothetical protein